MCVCVFVCFLPAVLIEAGSSEDYIDYQVSSLIILLPKESQQYGQIQLSSPVSQP